MSFSETLGEIIITALIVFLSLRWRNILEGISEKLVGSSKLKEVLWTILFTLIASLIIVWTKKVFATNPSESAADILVSSAAVLANEEQNKRGSKGVNGEPPTPKKK